MKPAAFYEAEGKKRRWFYTVDLQGRLFLEQMRVKNLTSCLKSSKVSTHAFGGKGHVTHSNFGRVHHVGLLP